MWLRPRICRREAKARRWLRRGRGCRGCRCTLPTEQLMRSAARRGCSRLRRQSLIAPRSDRRRRRRRCALAQGSALPGLASAGESAGCGVTDSTGAGCQQRVAQVLWARRGECALWSGVLAQKDHADDSQAKDRDAGDDRRAVALEEARLRGGDRAARPIARLLTTCARSRRGARHRRRCSRTNRPPPRECLRLRARPCSRACLILTLRLSSALSASSEASWSVVA